MNRIILLVFTTVLLAGLSPGCRADGEATEIRVDTDKAGVPDTHLTEADLFDTMLADGFDFPVGNPDGEGEYVSTADGRRHDGWYCATGFAEIYTEQRWVHTGEDWNGRGGHNTDLGQPVHAVAKGTVVFADACPAPWGNVVLIRHRYLENAKRHTVYSQYAHLRTVSVEAGQTVERRQRFGTIGQDPARSYPAHLHLEFRRANAVSLPPDYWPSSDGKDTAWVRAHYLAPTPFIRNHRRQTVPALEHEIIVAVKHTHRMTRYRDGEAINRYDIALSQEPVGHKQVQGDNRLPEGEYRLIQKARGPFTDGAFARFLGVAWIRLNYPNNHDARAGLARGIISRKEHDSIIAANNDGRWPPKNAALGGGIGIHGWAGTWPEDTRALTWGCISMRNEDLAEFYDSVSVGTRVLILP
jgi:hypothetical protein